MASGLGKGEMGQFWVAAGPGSRGEWHERFVGGSEGGWAKTINKCGMLIRRKRTGSIGRGGGGERTRAGLCEERSGTTKTINGRAIRGGNYTRGGNWCLVYGPQEERVVLCIRTRNVKWRAGTFAFSRQVTLEHHSQLIESIKKLRCQLAQFVKLGSKLGRAEGCDQLGHVFCASQQKRSDLRVAR